MSGRGHRRKDETLTDLRLLWPTDNPANIAQRMGYASLEGLLRSLSRWPEGNVWEKRLRAADALQRGGTARHQKFDVAS